MRAKRNSAQSLVDVSQGDARAGGRTVVRFDAAGTMGERGHDETRLARMNGTRPPAGTSSGVQRAPTGMTITG